MKHKNFCKYYIALILLLTVNLLVSESYAAGGAIKLKVQLVSGVDQILFMTKTGKIITGNTKDNLIQFTLKPNLLNKGWLLAYNDGQLVGPIVQKKGSKLKVHLVGSPKNKKGTDLKTVKLKLKQLISGKSYVLTPSGVSAFNSVGQVNESDVVSLGLNITSASSTKISKNVNKKASAAFSGGADDSDRDGLPDMIDVDKNGNGIIDFADVSLSGAQSEAEEDDSGVALPFTALYLNMADTINWHIGGELTQSEIDAIIGGENKFSVAFFFNFPTDNPQNSQIVSGYVSCDDALQYCRSSSAGASTAIYAGFSEGNSSLLGQPWSSLTSSGHENSLEELNFQDSSLVLAASIQPRVGTAAFRSGDSYTVNFLDSQDQIVTRKALTLPPYFITVPALKAYNLASSGSDQIVDYSDSNAPGNNLGNPIVLATNGDFAGKMRFVIHRLQRAAVPNLEDGDYKDFGHLNYGVTIQSNSAEYTCGGLYTGLSSSLTEGEYLGEQGSFTTSQGANIWPLVDDSDDYTPSNATDTATVNANTLEFTVDLASCLDRTGQTAGTYAVTILAAGEDTGHGANRAGQTVYVTIP